MDFFDILKSAIMQIINDFPFTETFVGQVIDEKNLKIRINDKILLCEQHIIRTANFCGIIPVGTRLLLLREQGGQKYFILNSLPNNKADNNNFLE